MLSHAKGIIIVSAIVVSLLTVATPSASSQELPDGYASLTVSAQWKLSAYDYFGAVFVTNNSMTEHARQVLVFVDGVPHYKHKGWRQKSGGAFSIAPRQTIALPFSPELIDAALIRVAWTDGLGKHLTPSLQIAALPYTQPLPKVTGVKAFWNGVKAQVYVNGHFSIWEFAKISSVLGLAGSLVAYFKKRKNRKRAVLKLSRRAVQDPIYGEYGIEATRTEIIIENMSQTATAKQVKIFRDGETSNAEIKEIPPQHAEIAYYLGLPDGVRIHVEWEDGTGKHSTYGTQIIALPWFQ